MSALTAVVAAGALVGGGLWLAWTGWSPALAPLHVVLGRLGVARVEVEPVSRDNLDVRVGVWARKVGIVEHTVGPCAPICGSCTAPLTNRPPCW